MIPHDIWQRARRASRRLLLLDYDGTLAPFRVSRMDARPHPRGYRALMRIVREGSTEVGLVTGRPIAELHALIGEFPGLLVGEHGWEIALPGGRIVRHPLAPAVGEGLERAAREAEKVAPGGRIQRKRTCVTAHLRGLSDPARQELADRLERLWRSGREGDGLRLRPFDGGLELRAVGRDKGSAVTEAIGRSPDGTFVVYVGDDDTDEDAFLAVLPHGIGIRVGPDERPSAAGARLPSIEEVAAFLEEWSDRIGRGAGQELSP